MLLTNRQNFLIIQTAGGGGVRQLFNIESAILIFHCYRVNLLPKHSNSWMRMAQATLFSLKHNNRVLQKISKALYFSAFVPDDVSTLNVLWFFRNLLFYLIAFNPEKSRIIMIVDDVSLLKPIERFLEVAHHLGRAPLLRLSPSSDLFLIK